MAYHHGPAYMRTSRPKTPVIYDAATPFRIGGSHVVRSSADDKVTIVGAGITLFEALGATTRCRSRASRRASSTSTRCSRSTPRRCRGGRETGWIVTVEDHYPAGGIGEAVMNAVAPIGGKVHQIAVRELPRSGRPEELVDSSACRRRTSSTREVAPLSSTAVPAFRPLLPLALASAGLAGGVLGARPPPSGSRRPGPVPRRRDPRRALSCLVAGWPAHRALDPRSDLDARRRRPRPARGRALAGPRRRPGARPGVVALWLHAGLRGARRRGRLRFYVVDAGGGEPRRVTSLPGDERWPSWLPDGRLVFANRDGASGISRLSIRRARRRTSSG